jgi:hypothetical protein
MTLTFTGTVQVVSQHRATYIAKDWSVLDLETDQPITIPEGADRVSRFNSRIADYTLEPKNDWTYAVTIWPGWDTRNGALDRICHICYAALRQKGATTTVLGPLHEPGKQCHSCGRGIRTHRPGTFFAKKRPAHWEGRV